MYFLSRKGIPKGVQKAGVDERGGEGKASSLCHPEGGTITGERGSHENWNHGRAEEKRGGQLASLGVKKGTQVRVLLSGRKKKKPS